MCMCVSLVHLVLGEVPKLCSPKLWRVEPVEGDATYNYNNWLV